MPGGSPHRVKGEGRPSHPRSLWHLADPAKRLDCPPTGREPLLPA